ncbi:LemA family protein [Aldersonia kunmingensis]|uniref:LemA family protein n=1 Tax=Aldersonia kunmingensis TaxID=408066 RepID=UPI000A04B41E|nr:LemA family protein [Aldersonia kunmingensis]
MGALITAVVVLVVGIAAVLIAIGLYNRLVRERNGVDNAWAQIEVQLKRRYDLIPNLVETVKGYASHERNTFEAVTAARVAAINAQGPAEQAKAENALSTALRSVFAVAEAYPQLQASTNFVELQNELSDTENRIAYSRQYYNDAVLTYNTSVQSVPSNIIAGSFGFEIREFFAAPENERGPVRVQF